MLRTTGRIAAMTAACVAIFAVPAHASHPAGDGGAPKPTVDMEILLRAAQLDPHRPGNGTTKGAVPSVKRVQTRLLAKKLLPSKKYVDGSFGGRTKSAYAAWQAKLGYTGIDANGLPGPTSLAKLLGKKYVLANVIDAGAKVTYDGKTVDARTAAMLHAASARLGPKCTLGLTQGSYNSSVGASEGTHDGGGAADLDIARICGKKMPKVVRAMRQVGFAAWHRPYIAGLWNEHIHAIAISDPNLSSGAADQVWDYFKHLDGLKYHHADTDPNDPRVPFTTWEAYQRPPH